VVRLVAHLVWWRMARRKRRRRHMPRVRCGSRPASKSSVRRDTFAGWEASEPRVAAPRKPQVEPTGVHIERSWHDRGGVAHAAYLIGDAWHVRCDTREFFDEVRRMGSNRLRISTDQVNCMWCTLWRRQ
jgi:hypothetical protein